MAKPPIKRTGVFISYNHRDEEWLKRLRVHLRPIESEYAIEVWDDTMIQPGSEWREEIAASLASAKVAVLLVSADFLASDYIKDNELPPLLKAAEEEGVAILPVILSPSRFSRSADLARFQSVNSPDEPLIGLPRSEQEAVLVRVAEAVEAALYRAPADTAELPPQDRKEED